MATATIKAELPYDAEKIWKLVTSTDDYAWRSDIDKITVTQPGRQFEERTKEGYITTFTITAYEEQRRYEFDMENSNMTGHWTGIFSCQGGCTTIAFTENVTAKKWFLKPLLGSYLKKQQALYLRDLENALKAEDAFTVGKE